MNIPGFIFYFNPAEKGYKCKKCERFPATGSGNIKEAVESLTEHPRRLLGNHDDSAKHQDAVKK